MGPKPTKIAKNVTGSELIERIVVAFDGSPASRHAMTLACEQTKKWGGLVYVVYVIEVKRALPLEVETDTEVSKGKAILAQAQAIAQETGGACETVLCRARGVGQAIVEQAQRQGAQLIVLGVSYKERLGTFDLGQAAPYILKMAPCWVWMCRQPPDQAR